MKQLLALKFGFNTNDIKSLINQAAGRDEILKSFSALLTKCIYGDYVVIYYAGHGSGVKNSLSREPDHIDQSIVPADACNNAAKYIRDKELGVIFNSFVDKGIVLTVIFDCCHSANLSRSGVTENPALRYVPLSDYDAKDNSNPLNPVGRKNSTFLMLSACQRNESASETKNEHMQPSAAFTNALIKSVSKAPMNASVEDIFSFARAILKSDGKDQKPLFDPADARAHYTLLGMKPGTISEKTLIPVIRRENGRTKLQAGIVTNLHEGSQLKMPMAQ